MFHTRKFSSVVSLVSIVSVVSSCSAKANVLRLYVDGPMSIVQEDQNLRHISTEENKNPEAGLSSSFTSLYSGTLAWKTVGSTTDISHEEAGTIGEGEKLIETLFIARPRIANFCGDNSDEISGVGITGKTNLDLPPLDASKRYRIEARLVFATLPSIPKTLGRTRPWKKDCAKRFKTSAGAPMTYLSEAGFLRWNLQQQVHHWPEINTPAAQRVSATVATMREQQGWQERVESLFGEMSGAELSALAPSGVEIEFFAVVGALRFRNIELRLLEIGSI